MLKTTQQISYATLMVYVMLRTATALAVTAGAKPLAAPAIQPSIQIVVSAQKNSPISLEARQAPLGQILKEITAKTGVSIHFSVLPDAPVTATCVGTGVGQIMDCLVAKQVGLVAHSANQDKPAEFWLLGSSVGSCQAVTALATPIQADVAPPSPQEQAEADRAAREQTESLLKQAKSKNADQRLSAIGNLAGVTAKDDAGVDNALRDALQDKDTNVRSQAIATIAQRGGDDLAGQLGQALKDSDVNVRMAVVSAVNSDAVLLRQALNDSDPNVRGLAQSKLDQLDKLEMRQSQ